MGEDQAAHVEITREIARRFNHFYGRQADLEARATALLRQLGEPILQTASAARTAWMERGDAEAIAQARQAIHAARVLDEDERELAEGWLTGARRAILPEPSVLLTPTSKLLGLDGRKMSKSYGNAIDLREPPESVEKKIRGMKTDPRRARRTDPGNPDDCPVWTLHEVYSDEARRTWVREGCTSAGIGCLECKQPVIEAVKADLAPMQARIREIEAKPTYVREVLANGCTQAQRVARETMERVRDVMGLARLDRE